MEKFQDLQIENNRSILFSGAITAIQMLLEETNFGKIANLATFNYNIIIRAGGDLAIVMIADLSLDEASLEPLMDQIFQLLQNSSIGLSQKGNVKKVVQELDPRIDALIQSFLESQVDNQLKQAREVQVIPMIKDTHLGFLPLKKLDGSETISAEELMLITNWINLNYQKIEQQHRFQKEFVIVDRIPQEVFIACHFKRLPEGQIIAIPYKLKNMKLQIIAFLKHVFASLSDRIIQDIVKKGIVGNPAEFKGKEKLLTSIENATKVITSIMTRDVPSFEEIPAIELLVSILEQQLPAIISALLVGYPVALVGSPSQISDLYPIIQLLSNLCEIKDYTLQVSPDDLHRLLLAPEDMQSVLEELGYQIISLHGQELLLRSKFQSFRYLSHQWNDTRDLAPLERLKKFKTIISSLWDQVDLLLTSRNSLEIQDKDHIELLEETLQKLGKKPRDDANNPEKLISEMIRWINPLLLEENGTVVKRDRPVLW